MKKIKLSILDQSVVAKGKTAKDAIDETLATVKLAEDLGYNRFWVSEHHNSPFIAGSSPEMLMVRLAAETKNIRIGSGGIMLPNHSALKMAENFRLLETLYPGRIDLGMGRAPGTDRITSSLLNPSNDFSEESYLKQLSHLQHFFNDSAATAQGPLLAVPQATTIPKQWILSSSGGSSSIAAKFGMGLVIAKFINGHVTKDTADYYRKHFKPSGLSDTPEVILSVFVLCGETEESAKRMRKFMDYVLVQFEKGKFSDFGTDEFIQSYEFSNEELMRLQNNGGRIVSGTAPQVKEQLSRLAEAFDVDEIIISTMTNNSELRKRSFELLAEEFELTKS